MGPLTIACTNIGWKWDDVWVHRLFKMVQEHCSVPFNFVCITDHKFDEGLFRIARPSRKIVETSEHHSRIKDQDAFVLQKDKPQGCWVKTDIFREGFSLDGGPIIHLDLDVCIVGDIAELVVEDGLGMPIDGNGNPNGSIYSFTPSERTAECYPEKIPYRTRPRGEQEWVAEKYEDITPLKGCYSYKIDIASRYGQTLPPNTVVVYFHGMPTPASDEVQNLPWVRKSWKGLQRIERV